MTLAVDVTGNNHGSGSSVVSITTTQANDVIVVSLLTGTATPTVADSTSLTWTAYVAPTLSASAGKYIATYWAVKPTAGATTITVTGSGTTCSVVIAISGANTTTPWDTNASLPGTNVTQGMIAPTFSTTAANTIAIANWYDNNISPNSMHGTIAGWTAAGTDAGSEYLYVLYEAFASAQTNVTVNPYAVSGGYAYAGWVGAIVAGSSTTPSNKMIGSTCTYNGQTWTIFCYCGGVTPDQARYVWINQGGTFLSVPVSAIS